MRNECIGRVGSGRKVCVDNTMHERVKPVRRVQWVPCGCPPLLLPLPPADARFRRFQREGREGTPSPFARTDELDRASSDSITDAGAGAGAGGAAAAVCARMAAETGATTCNSFSTSAGAVWGIQINVRHIRIMRQSNQPKMRTFTRAGKRLCYNINHMQMNSEGASPVRLPCRLFAALCGHTTNTRVQARTTPRWHLFPYPQGCSSPVCFSVLSACAFCSHTTL